MGDLSFDLERCSRATEALRVSGVVNGSPERIRAVHDAIRLIQQDGANALREHFIGVKRVPDTHADQRSDHPTTSGPTWGYIVFSIARQARARQDAILGPDHIYYLQCCVAYEPFEVDEVGPHGRRCRRRLSLAEALSRLAETETAASELRAHLARQTLTPISQEQS